MTELQKKFFSDQHKKHSVDTCDLIHRHGQLVMHSDELKCADCKTLVAYAKELENSLQLMQDAINKIGI